jgi:hypothetical protein
MVSENEVLSGFTEVSWFANSVSLSGTLHDERIFFVGNEKVAPSRSQNRNSVRTLSILIRPYRDSSDNVLG